MDRTQLKALLLLFLACTSSASFADDIKTLKLGKTIIYTGQVSKEKMPEGNGTLILFNQPKNATSGDTIMGSFSSEGDILKIDKAKAKLANGAFFEGSMTVAYQIILKKTIIEEADYKFDGDLSWPGELRAFGNFEAHRTTKCEENVFELQKTPTNPTTVYSVIGKHLLYKGDLSADGKPQGNGALYILAKENDDIKKCIDQLSGTFNGFHVDGSFLINVVPIKGQVDIEIEESATETKLLYHVNGLLLDEVVPLDTTLTITRHINNNTLRSYIDDFSFSQELYCVRLTEKYVKYTGSRNSKALYNIKFFSDGGSEKRLAEQYPIFNYDNGYQIQTNLDNSFSVIRPDGTFMKIGKDDEVVEFAKAYKEGVLHYIDDGDSEIIYYNGDVYNGTIKLSIDGKEISKNKWIESFIDQETMNDFCIAFVDGTYKHNNGHIDLWKDQITEIQKNKVDGSYENVAKVLVGIQESQLAEAETKWAQAKPALVKQFGKNHVDNIYNYKLSKGMPLDMFFAMRNMGLPYFLLSGPYNYGGVGSYYILQITNRKTGAEFGRIIRFDYFDKLVYSGTQF